MGYKELSDSYLLSMTKKQIIEQLRCAEHNFRATEETLKQQIENTKDWYPVIHGEWIHKERNYDGIDDNGSECRFKLPSYEICSRCGWQETIRPRYCPNCGAMMDGEISRDG